MKTVSQLLLVAKLEFDNLALVCFAFARLESPEPTSNTYLKLELAERSCLFGRLASTEEVME